MMVGVEKLLEVLLDQLGLRLVHLVNLRGAYLVFRYLGHRRGRNPVPAFELALA